MTSNVFGRAKLLAASAILAVASFGVLAGSARADESCTQANNVVTSAWAARGYTYAIKGSTFWANGSIDAVIRGRHVWNNSTNTCGLNDVTSFVATNQTSDANVGFSRYDGFNRIDYGSTANIAGCETGLACTFKAISGAAIVETDTRFSNAWPYATDGNPNAFDLWAVSSHEAGHALGLAHVDASWQTMHSTTPAGELRKRTLGCGDVRGMRRLYGGALPSC